MKSAPAQDPVTITIDELASTGNGVGTLHEDGFKRAVFVPYTVPGDVVLVHLKNKHKQYYEGELVRIIQPSEHRITPSCPHFATCGACDYLHIAYPQQLRSKENLLSHALHKAGIPHPPIQTVGATQQKNYRIRTRVFSKKGIAGFYKRQTHHIVPITHCDIITEPLNQIFDKELPDGEHSYAYNARTGEITSNTLCYYTVAGCELAFHPSTFAQSNTEMNEHIVQQILHYIPEGRVLELYSGNGNFGIPLAKKNIMVTAVEAHKSSHALAKKNAQKNGVIMNAICEEVSQFLSKDTNSYDWILLDPPRTGASDVIPALAGKAPRILYVSCDAKTLSRDLSSLCSTGYVVTAVHLYDMFPQTRHFETLTVLERK